MKSKCICIKNFYLRSPVNAPHFEKGVYYEYTDRKFTSRKYPEGYNVCVSKGEYLFFRLKKDPFSENYVNVFNTHFKTLKDIRKEKINVINTK